MEENEKTMNEVREENNMGAVEQMIPVHILAVCGDQSTAPDMRLSYSQVAFVTPEQYQLINLRLNDMARTINGFINENNKPE